MASFVYALIMYIYIFLTIHILRVSDQNGVSEVCCMVEIHHSGREPSNYICVCIGVYAYMC